MFTDWVNAGGNLIAMRPDKQLAGLLGLTVAAGTLAESVPADRSERSWRRHRQPDDPVPRHRRPLHAERRDLARDALFERHDGDDQSGGDAAASAASGGQAAAFTYDLARSIVYTRQGNPAWAGQDRDGIAPVAIRSNDLFYGAGPATSRMGRPEQGRHSAGRRTAAAARQPDPLDERRPEAAAAVLVSAARAEGRRRDDRRRPRDRRHRRTLGCLHGREPGWLYRGQLGMYPRHVVHLSEHAADQRAGADLRGGRLRSRAARTRRTAGTTRLSSSQTSMPASSPSFRRSTPAFPAPTTNRTHCIVWSD